MNLYRQNALIQADQADLLGELFTFFYSMGYDYPSRPLWLNRIGKSLDFEPDYIKRAIEGRLNMEAPNHE